MKAAELLNNLTIKLKNDLIETVKENSLNMGLHYENQILILKNHYGTIVSNNDYSNINLKSNLHKTKILNLIRFSILKELNASEIK